MNAASVFTLVHEKEQQYTGLPCAQLLQKLNLSEYVDIETKKDALFEHRLEFVCLSQSLVEQ